MKRILAIAMVLSMVFASAIALHTSAAEEWKADFEDGTFGSFEAYSNNGHEPTIVDDNGNKVAKLYSDGTGNADSMIQITADPAEAFGSKFVVEMRFKCLAGTADKFLFEFQAKPKSESNPGGGWFGNYGPFSVLPDGTMCSRTLKNETYQYTLGEWVNFSLCFDLDAGTIVGYINGNKAYSTTANNGDNGGNGDVTGYVKFMMGVPDVLAGSYETYVDDIHFFAGTEPTYKPEGELTPNTGDVTAIVALVAVLAGGLLVFSKKH